MFWFEKERFLGRSLPGNPFLWYPEDGVHRLMAVDDLGRASAVKVVVKVLP